MTNRIFLAWMKLGQNKDMVAIECAHWHRSGVFVGTLSKLEEIMQNINEQAESTSYLLRRTAFQHEDVINEIAEMLVFAYHDKRTIFACGNGGSAAQAAHFIGELTGRFKKERDPIPAIFLGMDIASLTAISNDYGYNEVFARPLKALGKKGDLLFAFSTSGNSESVNWVLQTANVLKIESMALLGKDGGQSQTLATTSIVVPSTNTTKIQEIHLFLIHYFCEYLDERIQAFKEGKDKN